MPAALRKENKGHAPNPKSGTPGPSQTKDKNGKNGPDKSFFMYFCNQTTEYNITQKKQPC